MKSFRKFIHAIINNIINNIKKLRNLLIFFLFPILKVLEKIIHMRSLNNLPFTLLHSSRVHSSRGTLESGKNIKHIKLGKV